MKIAFDKINMRRLPVVFLVTLTLLSCSKWDDFKKYTADGEILYTGRLDSISVFSGMNRIRITGKLNADPKIVALKIFWNNKADSVAYEIKRSNGAFFDQTFTVAEGVRTFTIFTYDAEGNSSVPVTVTGVSYGDSYRRTINNRLISSITYVAATDSTTINWDAIDVKTALHTELKYPKNPDGDSVTVITSATNARTGLKGFNYQTSKFTYRTIYRPDSTSIDTFATQYIVR
ncbi:DUF4998 domain-containing protein [Chitinophagaceae bacterium LB-8]|jgi:uncharacterized protein DUF4998|uniref:DUF4998 domain-containing protein n=1 Tax=Paraflavisolibacter caeni TaxID=2982496 RepID=A0A9X3B8U7_9BACT|nr:DUF4998 domain-containing protein [Paraflavisolibacter caeni]MCU7550221.1 DUF4998 domain-containing protein [Paraflavisolibacter caeni]